MYPLMLDGAGLRALVVGGGKVATRKTRALLESGAQVRVISPRLAEDLEALDGGLLTVIRREYVTGDIADALLVIAATSYRDVNARVARDARLLGRLVNVTDAPEEGNCVTPAAHRAGDLLIAVTAGGVPSVAVRVRDSIALRYGEPYARAIDALGSVRSSLLESGDRVQWAEVVENLIGNDFCDAVEAGELEARLAAWR